MNVDEAKRITARMRKISEAEEENHCIRCLMTPPEGSDKESIRRTGWMDLMTEFFDGRMTRSLDGKLCPKCRNDFLVFVGFAKGNIEPPQEMSGEEPSPEPVPAETGETPSTPPPGEESLDTRVSGIKQDIAEVTERWGGTSGK